MKKIKDLLLFLLLIMFMASCDFSLSGTSSATESSTASKNPIVTSTNNALKITPKDYLLSPNEVPSVFSQGPDRIEEYIDESGGHVYFETYSIIGVGVIDNKIIIAQQPWTIIPKSECTECKEFISPQIFTEDEYTTLVFFKGRALVSISVYGFDQDTLERLGKVVENKIPEIIDKVPPITFPENLQVGQYKKYLSSPQIGFVDSSGQVQFATIFYSQNTGLFPCWSFITKPGTSEYEIAVYDTANGLYLTKTQDYLKDATKSYNAGGCFLTLLRGKYEFKVAVNNILVSSIPFEIE